MTYALAAAATVTLVAAFARPWWVERGRALLAGRSARRETRAALPALVDGLVGALAAGLSLPGALYEIAPTMPAPLARSARRAAAALALGAPVHEALGELDVVVRDDDLAPLAVVLASFARSGGRIGDSLERVATLLRGRLALAEERDALTAQARLSANVLVALAPLGGVFFSLAMPDYAATLAGDGRALLVVALVLEVLGALWLVRIVRAVAPPPDLATFLDAVVVGLEAGLTFPHALAGIVDRAPGLARGAEARRLLADLALGRPMAAALTSFAGDAAGARVAALVASAARFGSPVAGLLVVQADAIRATQRHRAQETARRLPVLMLFPLALCILPALLVVFLGPPLLTLVE